MKICVGRKFHVSREHHLTARCAYWNFAKRYSGDAAQHSTAPHHNVRRDSTERALIPNNRLSPQIQTMSMPKSNDNHKKMIAKLESDHFRIAAWRRNTELRLYFCHAPNIC